MPPKRAKKVKTKAKARDPNPNMRTKSWGPPAWFAVTCFLMGYPKTMPTKTHKSTYKNFLIYFGKTLPCNLCRDSFARFIKEVPITDRVLNSRRNLVMWFFRIHNMVNKKLGCKVLTQAQLNKKYKWYDKFRAVKCSADLGGCLKSSNSVKVPKRTKVITFVDETALRLREKETKPTKKGKTNKRK